ncbi:MAG: hypothetical protein MSS69_10485 [Spirochaetales bacterium]|nr:hypothetical protein [Spirochaetales bacterium]
MKIEYIPREKAESIAQTLPFILREVTLSSPSSRFLMITTSGVFKVTFDLAILDEEGEITFLSDPALEPKVKAFLDTENK